MLPSGDYKYQDGLISKRLTTRMLKLEDAGVWEEFVSDKEAIRFFPSLGKMPPSEEALVWIERQLSRYRESRYGLQALISKENGEFIGQCGLMAQEVDGVWELEVGYHILPIFWGLGYATEAAKCFMAYGFEELKAESIISIIHVDNHRSAAVALKNGLRTDHLTHWMEIEVNIYRIQASSLGN